MDIYSFPGYQVEIEVPTNQDGLSKQVILDEAIRDEVDPVFLGEAGVSVYEILKEKTKLPVDDWVDVEDLGMEDDTHPDNVGSSRWLHRRQARRSGWPATSTG
jgi:hypothetical protein